ncbi:hypothetical protein BE21_07275 [Sorangium cellulosum]|uniref:DUF4935 domain-containing protein n=1 Tax=Sorangium cellulosum TaxID=56 RepID=A0A150T7T2_SORCE|nr:hypothetical protein BE21_07275 [Sorangium cellulosum]
MNQQADFPIYVVIDTSVLASLSGSHVLVSCVRALAQQQKVAVRVPRVVLDEYRTQIESREKASIETCLKALKDLPKRTRGPTDTAFKAELEAARDSIPTAAAEQVKALLDQLGAVELSMQLEDLNDALDAYFSGTGPVRSLKSREDIPDALIWATAKRLAREVGKVHVLVKDGVLYDACAALGSLVAHKSLNALLSALPDDLVRWAVTPAPAEWIAAVEKVQPEFAQIVSERLGDALYGRQCWIDLRPGTETWEAFGDAFIGEVVGGKVLGDVTVKTQKAEVVGGRYVAVPFDAVVEAEVEVHENVIYVGPQYEVFGTLAIQVDLDERAWDSWRMSSERIASAFDRTYVDMEIEEFQYHNSTQTWRPR